MIWATASRQPCPTSLRSPEPQSVSAHAGDGQAQVTLDQARAWKMRERAHYNGGRAWFGYGYQCIENPRLYRIDRYQRATRSVESEWQVDGSKCASLEEAVSRLNISPSLENEELSMLLIIPAEFAARSELKENEAYAIFSDPYASLHWLDRKGMIEWKDGKVRLTPLGVRYRDRDAAQRKAAGFEAEGQQPGRQASPPLPPPTDKHNAQSS